MDVIGSVFMGILFAAMLALMLYLFNRSRKTLPEASVLSSRTEEELLTLIRERLLEYRPKYVIFGPRSLDVNEIEQPSAAHIEIQQIRTETEATLRRISEETTAHIAAQHRAYEEQARQAQEEMERMRRVFDEWYRQMGVKEPLPKEVADAFTVLDLKEDASFDDIQQRYRFLVKRHHPDAGGDATQFIRVHSAYQTIKKWLESKGK